MWRGIYEEAQSSGVNIIYVAGEEFNKSPQAALYDLINSSNVDGLILWNSFVCPRSPLAEVQAFVERYAPLPIVTVELKLPGCSAVLVDNLQGIRLLIEHLIQVHHYQRIAFITEAINHTADARSRAFEQVMNEYGLFDAGLVGTLEELDQCGYVPGVDYRAMIVHSDNAALDVINSLRNRGVNFPEDVAVVGFNDGQEARSVIPALTTMRLPFRRMGRTAVQLLLDKLENPKPCRSVKLPMNIILRSSCGCFEPLAETALVGTVVPSEMKLAQALSASKTELLKNMGKSMGTPIEGQAHKLARRLLDVFINQMEYCQESSHDRSESRDFLEDISNLLRTAIAEGININRWNDAISQMRRFFLPYLGPDETLCLEDRCQQARILISQMAVRAEIGRSWLATRRSDILRQIEADLLVANDLNEFAETLTEELPRLQFTDLYLAMYDTQEAGLGTARLVLAYQGVDGDHHLLSGVPFPTKELLPGGYLPSDKPYHLLLEALHLGPDQIGYLAMHLESPADSMFSNLYESLRIVISSALKNIQLRQKMQEAVRQAEEANQLKSRFLSMVSHELRTPLNLIVGLSEMAIRQQNKGGRKSYEMLSRYLEQIYVSGQHLDRLIRDVLDLASNQLGQMTLIQQAIELTDVLEDAAVMGKQLAEQKNLVFIQDFPEKLPMVWGDRTRLRQVVLNLISNAVKFTAHGEIRLEAGSDGSEVQIAVSDTGLGIAPEERETIFNEFHQTNRTMVRGYGGIGLGLAITRKLVELHGGQIRVESGGSVGSGSKFLFTIPVISKDKMPNPASTTPHEGQVLILTDQLENSEVLLEHLRSQGFDAEIQQMLPLPKLIEQFIANPPGAVVLDVAPASEIGWDLVKSLKENPLTQDVLVLFYSLMAEKDTGSLVEADYLVKPLGAEQLVQVLNRYGIRSETNESDIVVLVVDDDPGILALHAKIVEEGIPTARVVTAHDGKQGLTMMRQEHPDLVLLDLMMPELDGFGVLKLMQADPVLRNIPVIILTAQVLTKDEMSLLNQGVASVLAKGVFSREEIYTRVETAISRSQRIGSEAQRLVRMAMGYIHEHFKESISRTDIATSLCVNEQYLSRCFNKEIGIGPMAYLGRFRIEQAKRLLIHGGVTITQIALDVGFSSQSYFSRIFQQETGFTPSAFMRRKEN